MVFAAVATVTPGSANLLAAASGARFGLRRSTPLLAGFALGLAALIAVAGAGLGALLHAAPALQTTMRGAGSGYLLWLAWLIGRSGAPDVKTSGDAKPAGLGTGIVLLWFNPKAWSMALAASAAYAGATAGPLTLALVLGTVFGAAAGMALVLWCIGGLLLARTLRTARQWQVVNAALGLLLAASVVPMWL